MSVISATNGTAPAPAPGPASSATPSGNDAQDKFLKLLVAQLKNQDPLNPLDNAEITSQMAQISAVSGIDTLNTTLQAMAASFSAGESLQATAMIGRRVLTAGSTLQLENGGAAGGVYLPRSADKLVISIRDGSGQLVHMADLGAQPAGVVGFQWDGAVDSGAAAAPGSYRFEVEAVQGGNKIDATALTLGLVSGVSQGRSGVSLNVNGIGAVALADVKQVM